MERDDLGALIRSINAGECVAFVGAGFSAPAVPSWADLLRRVAQRASAELRSSVEAALSRPKPSDFDLEACAQRLERELRKEAFESEVRRHLLSATASPVMEARLHHLRGIPFRSILTTNFDGVLGGSVPGRDAYFAVLRPSEHEWWRERFWDESRPGPEVVKLHGDIVPEPPLNLVLSRLAYRQRLYGNPAYRTFLRAVLATSTVLYMGFSFTDAYINELRSEILALLDRRDTDDPVAYAILNDITDAEAQYFRECEGIGVLSFRSNGGSDYGAFDEYLRTLYEATNPTHRLGSLLKGKRLIWLDAKPENNAFGMKFLKEAAGSQGCVLEPVPTWEAAISRLESSAADVLITHWGHQAAVGLDGGLCSVAERVLGEIRRRDLRVPVVIFADAQFARENRRIALRLGCQGYACSWAELFHEIERLFKE